MQELLHVAKGILGPLVLFGFVVFIHELGHFLVAKWCGVGVKKFAIGFGPKIFSRTWRGTEYSIRWIPLGGFVALKGMIEGLDDEEDGKEKETGEGQDRQEVEAGPSTDDARQGEEATEQEAQAQAERPTVVAEEQSFHVTEDLDALRNRNPLVKIAVFGAGVTLNYLTAIVFCFLLLWYGFPESVDLPTYIEKVPADSEWHDLGWRSGDRILEVRADAPGVDRSTSSTLRTWSDVMEATEEALAQDRGEADEQTTRSLWMRVARGDEAVWLPWSIDVLEREPEAFQPPRPPYVAAFTPNSPAHRARLVKENYSIGEPVQPYPTWEEMPSRSLEPEDRILAVGSGDRPSNMRRIQTWQQMVEVLRAHPDQPIFFAVERRNWDDSTERMLLTTVLERSDEDPDRGILGIYPGLPQKPERERLPFWQALAQAPGRTWYLTGQIVSQTARMFTRSFREIRRNVGGPVLIGILAYKSAQRGLDHYLNLFAVISIVLAVMNLLPIPVLDGGYILITLIEVVIRRPLPPKFLSGLLSVFMLLFLILFALIFLNDFMNWGLKML